MEIVAEDLEDLEYARSLLENRSFAVKVSNLVGTPVEKGLGILPRRWAGAVQSASQTALGKALDFAVRTLGDRGSRACGDGFHKITVAAAGALGGAFGLPALPFELSLSTTLMLRSIADIARGEGEDLQSLETRLACLEVFGLTGPTGAENGAETGYYATRAALASAVSEAAKYIALQGLREQSAPALVRLIGTIAARFGVIVSEKLAAQAVPLIGAAGGALLNTVFIDHFQDKARGHFVVRRLERKYGAGTVKDRYERL